MSLSKIKENPKERSFPILVNTTKFVSPKQTLDTRGTNKIYESKRGRSYFFEITKNSNDTATDCTLKIYTNDRVDQSAFVYQSTSRYPNKKFCVSLLLTHFFKLQKVIPKRVQHKYFSMLRNKLLTRYEIINNRKSSKAENNRKSKTFFNFTYKRYRFRLGIYQPCSYQKIIGEDVTPCVLPVPFVMSMPHVAIQRIGCCGHQSTIKKYSKRPNDLNANEYRHIENPIIASSAQVKKQKDYRKHFLRAYSITKIFDKWSKKNVNTVYSNRLGTTYETTYTHNQKTDVHDFNSTCYYKKVFRNLEHLGKEWYTEKTLKKQEKRRQRMRRHVITEFKKRNVEKKDDNLNETNVYQKMKYLTKEQGSVTKLVHHVNYRNIKRYPALYNHVPSSRVISEEITKVPVKIKANDRRKGLKNIVSSGYQKKPVAETAPAGGESSTKSNLKAKMKEPEKKVTIAKSESNKTYLELIAAAHDNRKKPRTIKVKEKSGGNLDNFILP
jgi:hypothetical protein